jgi:beta-carotene 3-hydroxylase
MSARFLVGALLGLGGMEAVSWVLHRYLFHGLLWRIHRTHHRPGKARLELNDVFSLGFAGVALGFIFLSGPDPLASGLAGVGAGMSGFGVAYFLVHDLMTHRRFGLGKGWAARAPGPVARLAELHRLHHHSVEQVGHPPFGFLNAGRELGRSRG